MFGQCWRCHIFKRKRLLPDDFINLLGRQTGLQQLLAKHINTPIKRGPRLCHAVNDELGIEVVGQIVKLNIRDTLIKLV